MQALISMDKMDESYFILFLNFNRTALNLSGLKLIRRSRLRQISFECPKLMRLTLNDCPQVTNCVIRDILQNCASLHTLNIEGCYHVSDKAFQMQESPFYTLKAFCSLRSINVSKCSQLTPLFCDILLKHCHAIEEVSISYCKGMNGSAVASLCGLPYLEKLDVSFVDNIYDEHLTFPSGSVVKEICMQRITTVTSAGARRIANACKQLRKLNLAWCIEIDNASIMYLAQGCPMLSEINISNCGRVTDCGLQSLSEYCSDMMEVDISWCQSISDEGLISSLKRWPRLVSLSLVWCPLITSASLSVLSSYCKILKSLTIGTQEILN
jgi:F-box/leucine-rich repeat protein 2/20